jgi:hypothetical protein
LQCAGAVDLSESEEVLPGLTSISSYSIRQGVSVIGHSGLPMKSSGNHEPDLDMESDSNSALKDRSLQDAGLPRSQAIQ